MQNFTSNTLAPSSNQSWFHGDGKTHKGRIFYKIFAGGTYNYSFMFVNAIDSTYSNGSHSYANIPLDEYKIYSLGIYITKNLTNDLNGKISLTISGEKSKTVNPKEVFYTDAIKLTCEKNDYVCLEVEFSGKGKIPYMEEMIIPSYVYEDEKWIEGRRTPLCASIICDRPVQKKIGFFGDSITEGIGVANDSYKWWCAQIAELIGEKYSYWDIGIGYGRAHDAASKGSWLEKAKSLDTVTVCFGVNDIIQGYSGESIKHCLRTTITELKNAGTRVILFTVPPFDYNSEKQIIWRDVNNHIRTDLSELVEIYDTVSVWGDKAPNEYKAIYGGHPNEEGSMLLANDFVSKIDL